jgi:gliding motility-associated lipoprotein GldH
MKNIIFGFVLISILAGCRQHLPEVRFQTFGDGVWERFDFVNFEFEIDEPGRDYNIYLTVRYNEEFQGQFLPVNLMMRTPSGGERIREFNLLLRNRAGEFTGEQKEDIYELSTLTHPGISFNERGKCKFELENLSTKYFTPGITAIGIVLEPVRK